MVLTLWVQTYGTISCVPWGLLGQALPLSIVEGSEIFEARCNNNIGRELASLLILLG